MAKWLGLDRIKSLYQLIKENGGIRGSLRVLYLTDTLKSGVLVGIDKYGNRYYENNDYFIGRNRWVMFPDETGIDYDASQVSPEWFGWLHHKTDLVPHHDPNRPKYEWMLDHEKNPSGTSKAYMPYSTTKPKIQPWQPSASK